MVQIQAGSLVVLLSKSLDFLVLFVSLYKYILREWVFFSYAQEAQITLKIPNA